jgi:hypothetical protein
MWCSAIGRRRAARASQNRCRISSTASKVAKLTYDNVTVNPAIAANAFAVPAAIQSKIKRPATANVPYQWVIRRLFLTRLTDSDAVIYPDGGGLKLVELAPNVQHVEGGTANNLIIAMKDYLIIFGRAVMASCNRAGLSTRRKQNIRGKPIKYLVLTHHHMDHTGGMRTYVAEGAHAHRSEPERGIFRKGGARAAHGRSRRTGEEPQPLKIYGIFENMTIRDENDRFADLQHCIDG